MVSQIQELSSALAAVVAKAAVSLVTVHSKQARSAGFVWRPGLVVTADEALAEDGDVHVTIAGGERLPARILGRDPTTDVALLGIERADLPAALLTRSLPAAGSLALVIGAEQGAATAGLGVVSMAAGAWRSMRGGEIDARLELDVRLRRHGEGALVVDAAGQAFGMAVLAPRRRVLVIPAATIERVAEKLQTHGRIPRGYLGLGLHPVSVGDRRIGAMVMSVDEKGPGAAAGIHQGDVIVGWNGKPIERLQPLLRALGADSVGQTVAFELRRGGQLQNVAVIIAERPAD